MKILILGGKKFIGYHIALEAEKRGHSVTFFNRVKTYPELNRRGTVLAVSVFFWCNYFNIIFNSTCIIIGIFRFFLQ